MTPASHPHAERAALSVRARHHLTPATPQVPGAPQIHSDHEERPLLGVPGRLVVGESRPDEENRGRLKVNVAFTLPPGAYATLVVKRLFWWTLQPGRERAPPRPERRPAPTPAEIHERRKREGFLSRKRARRKARGGTGNQG